MSIRQQMSQRHPDPHQRGVCERKQTTPLFIYLMKQKHRVTPQLNGRAHSPMFLERRLMFPEIKKRS